MASGVTGKPRPLPLDTEALERLALRYAERYATSEAKLRRYLEARLRARGWAGDGPPALDQLVRRLATLGYVDDRAFAEARVRGFARRGIPPGRARQALRAAGIEAELGQAVTREMDSRAAAESYARRRRFGRYAAASPSPETLKRQLAAMLRAGHGLEVSREALGPAGFGEETVQPD